MTDPAPLSDVEVMKLAAVGRLDATVLLRNQKFRDVAVEYLDLNSDDTATQIQTVLLAALTFQSAQRQPARTGNQRLSRTEEAIIVGRLLLDTTAYRSMAERVDAAIGGMVGVGASRVQNNWATYWTSFTAQLRSYLAEHPTAAGVTHDEVPIPALGSPSEVSGTGGTFTVPRQLPPRRRVFVNRAAELRELVRIGERASKGDRPTVAVLHGGHGVGKSAFSEHWAHEHRREFADGQIFLDFAEIRRDGSVAMGDAVAGVLRSFGLTEEQIPRAFHEKVQRYRSLTANRRVLLVLDDVEHPAQVTPLIPDSAGATVLVTTRMALDELLASGAERLRLDSLAEDKAIHLLEELIGSDRVAAEPDAAAELLGYCSGLPLAIDICGARLRADPETTLARFVAGLRDEGNRLAVMNLSSRVSVQAVFDHAYRALPTVTAAMYRRLGLHPAPSYSVHSAAAAAGVDLATAATALTALRSTYLLEMSIVDGEERYRFHDLLRVHARQLGLKQEDPAEQAAELRRITDFYAALSMAIDRAITKERLRFAPPRAPSPLTPRIAGSAEAFTVFERERASLVAVQRAALDTGAFLDAWVVGEALWPAYHGRLHPDEAKTVFTIAASAAREDENVEAHSRLLMLRSRAEIDLGEFETAATTLTQSRDLADRSGNVKLRGSVKEAIGVLHLDQGSYEEALAWFRDARDDFVTVDSVRGAAIQDYLSGRANQSSGVFDRAAAAYSLAARVLEGLDDPLLLGRVLLHWGETLLQLDDPAAEGVLKRSAEIAQMLGAEKSEAAASEALATLAERQARIEDVIGFLRRAVALYKALSDDRATAVSERLATFLN